MLDNYIIVLDEDSPISLAVKTINVSCIVPRAHRAAKGGERACNIVYGEVQNKFKNSMSARYSCTYALCKCYYI